MSSQVMNGSRVCSSNPGVSIVGYTTRSPVTCVGNVRTYRCYQTQGAVVTPEPWYHQLSQTYTTGRITSNMGALVLDEHQVIKSEDLQKRVSIKSIQHECELTREQIDYVLHEIYGMTEKDVREAYTTFMKICSNGKMTREMFTNVLQKTFSEGNASSYCRYAFHLFDRDNDGTLSFTEFALAMQIYTSTSLEDSLNLVFDIFDYDKSGTIDQKEILQMISATSELCGKTYTKEETRNFATEIFEACGKERNTKITKEEFVNCCINNENFCRLLVPTYDTDSDDESENDDKDTDDEDDTKVMASAGQASNGSASSSQQVYKAYATCQWSSS
ncbi:unnamed protein product [Adineta ricciae]|uniref:EF-hand domain-containing protein n=1 Tax=Adineta ricciae TaxID=249248 RepID=A0A815GIM2_ADIRI|nr:unnamed protein product [Adineta ricciae]